MSVCVPHRRLIKSTAAVWAAAIAAVCIGLSLPGENYTAADMQPCISAAGDTVSMCDSLPRTHRSQPLPFHPLHGVSEEELELLARVISAEARGEPFEGQVAVGAVILNRIGHPDFPDSMEEVCYQPGAFCGVADGQISIDPSPSCRQAAVAALCGSDPTDGAVFFYNPETAVSEWIRTRQVVAVIGDHCFCI